MWVRALLGLGGLVVFGALAVGDARALKARRGLPVAWTLLATGASILAGFAHLALTPGHWDERMSYGVFFLAAGVVQLGLASVMGRPAAGDRVWSLAAVVNLSLIGLYVVTRFVAPAGSDLPEPVDAVGVFTVVVEAAAALASIVVGRRLSRNAVSPPH